MSESSLMCNGSQEDISIFLERMEWINLFVVALLCLSSGCFAMVTTVIVCRRKRDQRPRFVIFQLVFVNIFWLCFVVYIVLLSPQIFVDGQRIPSQTNIANTFATIGDYFFMMHDWIFISQYLRASLLMPIVIDERSNDLDKEKLAIQKQRAKMIPIYADIGFYILSAAWLVVSVYTGSF